MRSGLLLLKKRSRDFVPLLETRILLDSSGIGKKYRTCCELFKKLSHLLITFMSREQWAMKQSEVDCRSNFMRKL